MAVLLMLNYFLKPTQIDMVLGDSQSKMCAYCWEKLLVNPSGSSLPNQ